MCTSHGSLKKYVTIVSQFEFENLSGISYHRNIQDKNKLVKLKWQGQSKYVPLMVWKDKRYSYSQRRRAM